MHYRNPSCTKPIPWEKLHRGLLVYTPSPTGSEKWVCTSSAGGLVTVEEWRRIKRGTPAGSTPKKKEVKPVDLPGGESYGLGQPGSEEARQASPAPHDCTAPQSLPYETWGIYSS